MIFILKNIDNVKVILGFFLITLAIGSILLGASNYLIAVIVLLVIYTVFLVVTEGDWIANKLDSQIENEKRERKALNNFMNLIYEGRNK